MKWRYATFQKKIQNNDREYDTGPQKKNGGKKKKKRMEAKVEKMQEMFNKDLEELKNKQTEMNNTVTEMKNPPDLTNKGEIGSLPEKEFRIMIVKII